MIYNGECKNSAELKCMKSENHFKKCKNSIAERNLVYLWYILVDADAVFVADAKVEESLWMLCHIGRLRPVQHRSPSITSLHVRDAGGVQHRRRKVRKHLLPDVGNVILASFVL